ncbi:MAG: class I SAM-dependent methyltransferase [Gemmatimonas sp.]
MNTSSLPRIAIDIARAVPGLRPLWRGARVGWVQGSSEALDRWYGIRTTVLSGSQTPQFADDNGYEPAKYPAIRTCLNAARLSDDDVFFDIGCGMGRVLCMAARRPVRKCVGVEFMPSLAAVAERNATGVRGRRSAVEVWQGDATTFDYGEGTVFFMYNPFREPTMRRFTERLRQSVMMRPRRIRIVYMAPRQDHVLAECGWLARRSVLDVQYHVGVTTTAQFWENVEHTA